MSQAKEEILPNVLAERYASPAMRAVWSPAGRIRQERDLWIAVMKAQRDLGLDVPEEAIAAYEAVRDEVDLASIDRRERVLLHDVKARIEEFSALAGHERIHLGMTSRDLTENVEQLKVLRSLQLVRRKAVAALGALAKRARETRDLMIAGRTHNVPAQPTTMGKRLAMFGEELLAGLQRLDELIGRYPARGLKGAVGTQLDSLTLLGGDASKVAALERRLLDHLGFARSLASVGQVYPRSLDFDAISALAQLSSAAMSFSSALRLMAGQGLASEGFREGQVGSSAMPHKVNCRNCERIRGLGTVLRGHVAMAGALAGDQWNEGDVSCSAPRRVLLPDAFFAMDGLLETWLTVIGQMEVHEEAIRAENQRQLPFLATTTILMEAVKAGAGREAAHEAIKEAALKASRVLREGGEPDMVGLLAGDSRVPLDRAAIELVLGRTERFVGAAPRQTDAFCAEADAWLERFPEARDIRPGELR